jgi:hypothetical protein
MARIFGKPHKKERGKKKKFDHGGAWLGREGADETQLADV